MHGPIAHKRQKAGQRILPDLRKFLKLQKQNRRHTDRQQCKQPFAQKATPVQVRSE